MHLKNDAAGFEIVTVQSGDRSLRSREFGETFHPVVGPMAEAVGLHVRQQRLVERADGQAGAPFVIWDVGLGAAANAIAVLEAFAPAAAHVAEPDPCKGSSLLPPRPPEETTRVDLHSFDLTADALRFALAHADELGYVAAHAVAVRALLEQGRATESGLHWTFHPGDFRQTMSAAPAPHAILYDPYSPQSNPAMWSLDHFTRLQARLSSSVPCLLSNYTRSTAVRVTLLLAGFFVGHGHATGEKDQTTIASNTFALLDEPLDLAWLQRVRRSTNSAPLRLGRPPLAAISAEDWERLAAHPQFGG